MYCPQLPLPQEVREILLSILYCFPLTPSSEWAVTFTLQDSDMINIPVNPKGLKARFFCRTQEELPPVSSIGDIVLLRNCKASTVLHTTTDIFDIMCRSRHIDKYRPSPTSRAARPQSSTNQVRSQSLRSCNPSLVKKTSRVCHQMQCRNLQRPNRCMHLGSSS